ncbi:MAG: hypothetical protein HXS53_13075 [Theionarchaea archaeon]|nr:hypothetical protein [Theionarchaea archaeon]
MGGIIVLADTHFGIRKGTISMPGYCADFLHHITTMHHEEIQAYDGKIMKKVLESPEKVIFLGDIVELWDSQNEAVSFCMSSLLSEFSQMMCSYLKIVTLMKVSFLQGTRNMSSSMDTSSIHASD